MNFKRNGPKQTRRGYCGLCKRHKSSHAKTAARMHARKVWRKQEDEET